MAERNITPEELKTLREKFKKGMRVECIRLEDEYTPIPAGTKGTVDYVDDIGTVHVNWDCGSSLGAVYGTDEIKPEIPVADNAEYVPDSDTFEPEDIDFGDEDGEGGAD